MIWQIKDLIWNIKSIFTTCAVIASATPVTQIFVTKTAYPIWIHCKATPTSWDPARWVNTHRSKTLSTLVGMIDFWYFGGWSHVVQCSSCTAGNELRLRIRYTFILPSNGCRLDFMLLLQFKYGNYKEKTSALTTQKSSPQELHPMSIKCWLISKYAAL